MLTIQAPNIFRGASNDYNIRVLKCKNEKGKNYLPHIIANIIEEIVGVNPFERIDYRNAQYVKARYLFLAFMIRYSKLPYAIIGNYVGKDHCTINYMFKYIKNAYETERDFREIFDRIEAKVKLIIK